MPQTLEPGIKSEHSEGKRTGGDRAQTTNAELRSSGIDVPASKPASEPLSSAWWDKFRIEQIADTATAFLFAGLAPALVMAALWHTAEIAPLVFAFTFGIALAHAVLFGLPLFLVFRLKGWINILTCVVFGFAVGAVPDGVLTWPMQHAILYASRSVDGVPTIIDGVITAAGWVSYVKPVIYCGLFGALGGGAFWVALICARHLRKSCRRRSSLILSIYPSSRSIEQRTAALAQLPRGSIVAGWLRRERKEKAACVSEKTQ
jgi:hypothetical protein